MGSFWSCLLVIAFVVGAVYGIGAVIASAVGRKSDIHRRRGRYVLQWATRGATVGGLLTLWKASPDNVIQFGTGCIGIGVIAGVIVGNALGFLAIRQSDKPSVTAY